VRVVIPPTPASSKTKNFSMRTIRPLLGAFLLVLAASCATPESRVQKNQAVFNTWPADVQQKVRAGKIELGFTPAMVRVALGEPARVTTRTTGEGVAEGWIYADKSPTFSVGLGFGSARGSSAFAGGVAVGDTFRDNEAFRVIFRDGRVVATETRK
jgi:hypothetical protein